MIDFTPTEYPPRTITTTAELIERLAKDLVDMHNEDGTNLEYWPAAREFVTRFNRGDVTAKSRRGK